MGKCPYWKRSKKDETCFISVERRYPNGEYYSDSCGNKATHVALGEMNEDGVIYPDQKPSMDCYACRRHVKESRKWQEEFRKNPGAYLGI